MKPTVWPSSRLGALLARIERHYGVPRLPQFAGPFEMILWEIVAYLADDSRREIAFRALRDRVGLTPPEILAAPAKVLGEITRMGGSIAAEDRARRLRTAARMVMEDFDGDLSAVLTLPTQKAKKFLMRFPMIGEPGAEKILMLSGILGVLPLESNGVRVLTRLGIGEDRKSYAATYKSIREVTVEQLPGNSALLTKAHLLLRQHGQTLCLRNGPVCHACPVNSDCPAAEAGA
jgi:endonuclease III